MVTKKQILAQIQELTDYIKSDEFERLKKDSERLKEIEELLSHIKFKIKDIKYFKEEQNVVITYELPKIVLNVDAEGNVNKDDFFYSVNSLELINLEDMQKIQNCLEQVKNVS